MVIRKDKLAGFSVVLLLFTILCSINSVLYLTFGIAQLATILYLIATVAIFYTLPLRLDYLNKLPVFIYLIVYLNYIFFGLLSRAFVVNYTYLVDLGDIFFSIMTGLLVWISLMLYFLYYNKSISNLVNPYLVTFYCLLISVFVLISQPWFGINNFYSSKLEAQIDESRTMGVFANPNVAGLIANLFSAFCLYKLYEKFRLKYLLFLWMGMYGTFLTLSKSAIFIEIFLLFFLLIYIAIKSKNNWWVRLFLGLLIIAILISYFKLQGTEIELTSYELRRLISLFDLVVNRKFDETTTSARSELFELGIIKIKENWFLGNGIGYFQWFPGEKHGVHNTYLMILGESGVVSFFTFLAYFIVIIYLSLRFLKKNIAFFNLCLIFILLFYSVGSHNFFDDKVIQAINVLILATLFRSSSNSKNQLF